MTALPGYRFNPSAPPVPGELLDAFREAQVAIVSDNLNRLHGTRSLRPFHGNGRLVGTAVTVKTRAGDNLIIHKALAGLRPGDVLVVDGGGDIIQALVGEIMMQKARAAGAAGFVIDGAIRDVGAYVAAGFPCFARSVTHRGPYKAGPGEINVPVAIDGMVVMPGDLVIGDEDGVLAFDRSHALELAGLMRAQEKRESEALAAIAAGQADNYTAVAAGGKETA